MGQYYIYMYLDLDNCLFYIGKGKDNRYCVSLHLRQDVPNNLLKNKIRKVGTDNVKVHFLHKNLIEKESFYWEKYWIKYIGRRDLKEGTLCNLTDGGEGVSGYVSMFRGISRSDKVKRKISKSLQGHAVSEKTKQKISKVNKNKPSHRKGKKSSEEHKQKISKACMGRSSSRKGKKLSETVKRKISRANKGKIPWNKGVPCSEEQKRKISKINKGRVPWNKGLKGPKV